MDTQPIKTEADYEAAFYQNYFFTAFFNKSDLLAQINKYTR